MTDRPPFPSSGPDPSSGPGRFRLGEWQVDLAGNRLWTEREARQLEPKVADLLGILAQRPGEVISRKALFAALWPGVTVGEDTLARLVSKLRRALGDTPRAPSYVETVSKRGYRLIAPVEVPSVGESLAPEAAPGPKAPKSRFFLLAGAAALLLVLIAPLFMAPAPDAPAAADDTARAEDRYMRFTRADNEAAIVLYERAAAEAPGDAGARAGLANALVQRVIRWPRTVGLDAPGAPSLGEALARGLTTAPEAASTLTRARALAERAVALDPGEADHWRALGLVTAAQGDLEAARAAYEKALARDPGHWPSLLNLGELDALEGDDAAALRRFEAGFAAMQESYADAPQRIGPWLAPFGVMIAERHLGQGRPGEAETWYRRVLEDNPFDPAAVHGLASLLIARGEHAEAAGLCAETERRLGREVCEEAR